MRPEPDLSTMTDKEFRRFVGETCDWRAGRRDPWPNPPSRPLRDLSFEGTRAAIHNELLLLEDENGGADDVF